MIVDTDFGLSITGVAGPGYSERKPVGLVYIGISRRGKDTAVYELNLKGNRETIRMRSTKTILYHLWKQLKEIEGEA
ncbi:Nicotinamide-nucleotide amidohydrolase PncC [compost metagenome]